jgi:DNA-binding YbaB/EbfC family protein
MKNLAGLMKQAHQMQSRMEEMQARVQAMEVAGESGAGMVRVTLNGKGEMRGLRIDPKIVDPQDAEVLQDLVMAAHRDAKTKLDAAMAEEMRKVTGGIDLPPGLKLPF